LPAARLAGLPPASNSPLAAMTPPHLGQGGRDGLLAAGFSAEDIAGLEASGAAFFFED